MAVKRTTISARDEQHLEAVIGELIGRGFQLQNRTPMSAILSKPKKLNPVLVIVGTLMCFVGLGVYLIMYTLEKDLVVYVSIGGQLTSDAFGPSGTPASPI